MDGSPYPNQSSIALFFVSVYVAYACFICFCLL